jgi:16S rRNA (guanine527-N7)-methyltransferase
MKISENIVMETIRKGAEALDVSVSDSVIPAFGKYFRFLTEHAQNYNLTAITEAQEVANLHFLDSLALLNVIDFEKMNVIDIGSGAGFPGIPLKMVCPSIDLTLLDATSKRVDFLSKLCDTLDISAHCIHARAEEASHNSDMREQYDIVTSRAVARLNILCELCLPFVRVNGYFLAMKGVDSVIEVENSQSAIETLGAIVEKTVDYAIPGTEVIHRVVVIRKTSPTPEKYPRRFAKMQKMPL